MVQISLNLSRTNVESVPYATISAYMVQVCLDPSRTSIIFVPYMKFLVHMVQAYTFLPHGIRFKVI
jgi:hypothetical protein